MTSTHVDRFNYSSVLISFLQFIIPNQSHNTSLSIMRPFICLGVFTTNKTKPSNPKYFCNICKHQSGDM